MSAILKSLSKLRQFDTSSVAGLARDLGRFSEAIDGIFGGLPGVFRGRRGAAVGVFTPASRRPELAWDRANLIDATSGPVDVYLPRAKPDDAGKTVQWVTTNRPGRSPTNIVTARAAGGQLINTDDRFSSIRQGLHEAEWDGSQWWTQTVEKPRYHKTDSSTVGLWQLDLTTWLDSSGNGHTLAVETGSTRLTNYNGLFMRWLDGSTNFVHTAFDADLAIAGDMTIEMLVVRDDSTTARAIVSHEASGDLSAANCQYRLTASNTGMVWRQESGAGVDSTFTQSVLMPMGTLVHWGIVRTGNVVQHFINGWGISPTSAALTTPDGGASGRFRIGAGPDGASSFIGSVCSVRLTRRARTGGEMRDSYNYTLGPLYGHV